jgi:cellulose synthase/poly-beta-1,6-N-acetylglucosamine synthase-like glycosyltransferase/exo-beta-1,3-glucanase (GH17 family)
MRSVAAVVALVACLHAGAWAIWQTQANAPNIEGVLNSLSYSPFLGHPDDPKSRPTAAQIRADLKAIAPYTKAIRLYKSTGGMEMVPAIANEFGLKVTLGIALNYTKKPWKLGEPRETPDEERKRNEARNEREITTAIDLARKHRNVNAIMVGNETVFTGVYLNEDEIKEWIKKGVYASGWTPERGGWEVKDLIKIIHRVKREVDGRVPVTTGEIHAEYAKHPELGFAVDYVAAHVLPYWNDVPAELAVQQAVDVYSDLRREFKGKRIVIAEFGWPSGGYNRHSAVPGKLEQANVIRSFVAKARALGIEYNIIEAYDQPWKTTEGSVGAYWGLFDVNHDPKFAWTGPISDGNRGRVAAIAVAVGLLVSLPIIAIGGATLMQVLLLAGAANVVGAWVAVVFDYWHGHYFVFGTAFALGLGTALLIPLVLIALWRIEELAGIIFGRPPSRLLAPAAGADANAAFAPKVSIHIPAYMEPPEMLKATLDAVARLNYPNFECIIVINNTPNAALWEPVEAHCATLGERFRFINAPKLDGYKAGALRLALANTALDAEIIGVIDSDYAVSSDWLSDLVPTFADPTVGMVQAPQDHRDGDRTPLHYAMNGEYAGFFDIGMIQRNEANAIITHGTMCLIRRTTLEKAGGWSSDTICEDTDLGLTILELGWQAHYTNRRYGYGLLPDSFEAYKKQRDRWASGGFQIVKKHWRRFLPGASQLTRDQRREFAFGWINWLGAETVGVVVAALNLVLVPIVAFAGIAVPDKVLTLPILATFAVSIAHFIALYRRRVPIAAPQAACAMLAAMAMQWTVARAVANGLIRDHLTFVRTAKGGVARRRRVAFPAFYEAVIGGLLGLGAAIVFAKNGDQVQEINLFGCVLLVQSIPFLAAVALAAFESSPLNDFATLRNLQARFAESFSRELPAPRAMNQTVAAPEKQMEVVQ